LKDHRIPTWYSAAKLGIFIHWGLYSVPGFAPVQYGDIVETVGKRGYEFHFAHNPYSEWYLNSLRVGGPDYLEYHRKTYGENFAYDDFIPLFNEAIRKWNPMEMAEFFAKSGAKYVVLTTKHHDGFTLWPSRHPNPFKEEYHANRNIVGELTDAVRKQGLRMGLYYSGGLDWTFNEQPIRETTSMIGSAPTSRQYGEYIDAHFRELIDIFRPDVLWNDISYPVMGRLHEIIAYYYNTVPEGVANDRWIQIPKAARYLQRTFLLKKLINKIAQSVTKKSGFEGKAPVGVGDFSTPEYAPKTRLRSYYWEACRGLGRSFGINRLETEEHMLSPKDLIHSFIDIVSKNGNLLLNVGPEADGSIPQLQKVRLEALGGWLAKNGEGIYGTVPWKMAEMTTSEGFPVRFTQKIHPENAESELFVFILGYQANQPITLSNFGRAQIKEIRILGSQDAPKWEWDNQTLRISPIDEIPSIHALGLHIR
jgi:alpha-L-fucosidase